MSSDNIAIRVEGLSKCFNIYDQPLDRLKQSLVPRLQSLLGRSPVKYFREFWALKDISFEVSRGETVGVIGRNGSGKSTLLQLICATLSPTSGKIGTDGRTAALLELGSGFNPEFTGRENVYLNGAILGLSRGELDKRFDDIVTFADIGDFLDQPVKTYSSGMVLRLAFAVAINVDPQILVVDEALSVGDEMFQRKCYSQIEQLKKRGVTILFVSHSAPTVIQLCDRVLLLDGGEMLTMGLPKTIVGKYQRLLYAPADKRKEIREEIRSSSLNYRTSGQPESANLKRQTAAAEDSPLKQSDVEEFYDENLKSQSILIYDSRGAVIEDPHILTLSGKRVNCLKRGKSYLFTYKVRFDSPASNIRFTMVIKTTSGINLGGGISAPDLAGGIPYIAAGTNVRVEIRFNCMLSPGCYFVNCGVLGIIDSEEVVMHRILDADTFRVLHDEEKTILGIIDFGCSSDIVM